MYYLLSYSLFLNGNISLLERKKTSKYGVSTIQHVVLLKSIMGLLNWTFPYSLSPFNSKEHVRMLSQRVMDREVYFNPGRMGHVDALSILSAIERYAKVKQGPWQEKLLLIS